MSTERSVSYNISFYFVRRVSLSASERKEILTPAAAWMNLHDTMRSEISQTEKDKHCMTPLP